MRVGESAKLKCAYVIPEMRLLVIENLSCLQMYALTCGMYVIE